MSQPAMTNARAFSTSPVSSAKKTYQLNLLQKAKKILKATEAAREAERVVPDPNDMRDFLVQVRIPQESDRIIRGIEANIHDLEGRISKTVDQLAKAPKALHPEHVSDPIDAANSNQLIGKAKWHKQKAAHAREEKVIAMHRTEHMNELGGLLREYKKQVTAVKEQAQKRAELRERKEEVLNKKRMLLKQLQEHGETERRAKMIVRVTEKDDSAINAIFDDALTKVKSGKKEPRDPAKIMGDLPKIMGERPDVPPLPFVMRKVGASAVSTLTRHRTYRSSEEDALADPIMDKERAVVALGAGKETRGMTGKQNDETVVDASTSTSTSPTYPNLCNLSPPLSPHEQNSTGVSKLTKNDALGVPSPSPVPLLSKNPGFIVPPSGFVPLDENLIISFGDSVPQLQQQVSALRDRLKSSYPRIDTLPYDVSTSHNKRTLQTWLKILMSRWQTRFDGVYSTGQVDKAMVDERLKVVLDQMVREHDLSNDAAERMAMRWHEVFYKRSSLDSDAEGKLDWEEMEAGGMGFLVDDTGYEQPDAEALSQAQHGKPETISGEPSGSTKPGMMGRRMYSTSSRRTSSSSSEFESRTCSIDKADGEDRPHQPQPQTSVSPRSSVPQSANPRPHLPHLTPSGSAQMVSVSDKQHTTRTAIAVGTVHFTNPTPLQLIRSNSLKKGDVLGTSRIAGIMAAKKCPEIIPLCHPIALTHVGVELRAFGHNSGDNSPESLPSTSPSQYTISPGYGGIQIEAKVQCTGPTGVEMEALTAVMGAALSVVDMCKAVDKFQRVHDVRVVLKEGGKSGVWREEGWKSWQD